MNSERFVANCRSWRVQAAKIGFAGRLAGQKLAEYFGQMLVAAGPFTKSDNPVGRERHADAVALIDNEVGEQGRAVAGELELGHVAATEIHGRRAVEDDIDV